MFRSPLRIDVTETVTRAADHFADELHQDQIEVLPLVDGDRQRYDDGWCTYVYKYDESPELEVICGGVNSKTAKAGAIWRQGNLLHFGFEQAPPELNEAGRSLLINAISYIAHFTEDRPIARTPSPFAGIAPAERGVLTRAFARPNYPLKNLEYILSKPVYQALEPLTDGGRKQWCEEFVPYLHADEEGKLAVDEEAKQFAAPPNQEIFIQKAIAELRRNDAPAGVRRLLARYVPDGPGAGATPGAWETWWRENKPYVFFSDSGGYRWYVDPLAKKRSVPTAKLRGPARADLPDPGDRPRQGTSASGQSNRRND
jgi:hypothetical protein